MADSRPVVTYIERHQLVDYLAGEQKREVLIVDVRDSVSHGCACFIALCRLVFCKNCNATSTAN